MAQAARLNLRMQKEVKLLLTDPPPAASFPSLSSDHHSSLTSIDAHFQGPEGTVYANGVFKIKIQIPERYPFQPPIVTFATPIYHPNIDNGGRICLDILNLPPKGTWQPSLNISAVLTSIGLLLSEPNPDDGLMHEASREYKYNRQAFDQNARSMTEKYARAGEENEGSSTSRNENKGPDESICTNRDIVEEIYKGPVHDYVNKHTEIGQFRETKEVATVYSMNPDILQTTRNKLSLKVPVVSHSRNNETTNMNMPNQCSSLLKNKSVNCKDATARDSRGSTSFKLKKVSLTESLPFSGPLQCPQYNLQNEKENLVPNPCLTPQLKDHSDALRESGMYYNKERMGKQVAKAEVAAKPSFKPLDQIMGSNGNIIVHSKNQSSIVSDKKQQIGEVHDSGNSSGKFKQFTERSPIHEAVVVLDSEDSEEENVPVRSKLSLARRCLSRKRKPTI